ncbi:complement factor I-like [Neosynchiropus ocellatus]
MRHVRLTRRSCDLVFCPPWQYCVHGVCSCKPPYLCPRERASPVCSHGNRTLLSYCQAMAVSCLRKAPQMSHFGTTCTAEEPKFRTSLETEVGAVRVFVPGGANGGEDLLVCEEQWDMAAANVACREAGQQLGAATAATVSRASLTAKQGDTLPSRCVSVRCRGDENSLAECVFYDKTSTGNRRVATATCGPSTGDSCDFRCVSGKCVSLRQTCDGVDDCGDRSDEMCCKKCRGEAFRCSTGVCLHGESVGDGVMDCLDGADEAPRHTGPSASLVSEYISPRDETRASRVQMESRLACGVSHANGVEDLGSARVKRVVGGIPTRPTQVQWQVAIMKDRRFYCGGVYIGGCWVITTAHCIRPQSSESLADGDLASQPKPNLASLRVKLSLWKRHRVQDSTDIVPVEDVHIHPDFNPRTLENDIALVQMMKLPNTEACFSDNPFVTPICVPWSRRLFHPNRTCTISGWGETAGGRLSAVLQWANVTLVEDCHRFYGESFKPGMTCAGELEGLVDSCHGDSGGPLVCKDELAVSYLWGITSWGSKCGQAQAPGVYTEIAHFFEWIRGRTGWTAVTKFNS